MLATAQRIVGRELLLAARRPADALGGLAFFAVVGSLFPLAVGPDAALLRELGPGVLWVAALLAVIVSLPRLFAADRDDGTIEQMLLSPQPLAWLVFAKVAAHWLVCCGPLLLLAPLLGLQFGLAPGAVLVLWTSLLLGTPTLAMLGALGAALTLGMRGAALLALIVLPLCIPVLVFGSGAAAAGAHGVSPAPQLSLLGACLVLALPFCPWAIGAALRLAVE